MFSSTSFDLGSNQAFVAFYFSLLLAFNIFSLYLGLSCNLHPYNVESYNESCSLALRASRDRDAKKLR